MCILEKLLHFAPLFTPLLSLLAVIAYFIKRYFDNKSKKNEVKYSLFHNQKLSAITKFIEAYTPLESFFWQVSYRDVPKGSITSKELDAIYQPLFNKFLATYYALHLVLDENELIIFEEIEIEIRHAFYELSELFFIDITDRTEERSAIANYTKTYSLLTKNNQARIIKIGNNFKASFPS